MSDYQKAKRLGNTSKKRWEMGMPRGRRRRRHHPMSLRIMAFLKEHDFKDCGDTFCWKDGGDGDNGEELMYQLDAFFETVQP